MLDKQVTHVRLQDHLRSFSFAQPEHTSHASQSFADLGHISHTHGITKLSESFPDLGHTSHIHQFFPDPRDTSLTHETMRSNHVMGDTSHLYLQGLGKTDTCDVCLVTHLRLHDHLKPFPDPKTQVSSVRL